MIIIRLWIFYRRSSDFIDKNRFSNFLYSLKSLPSGIIHNLIRRSSSPITIPLPPIIKSKSHQIYIFISRIIIFKTWTFKFWFILWCTMNKNWFLSGFSIFCWKIPGIHRHIKKEMTTIQTNLSWKLPNMDPSFFESFWIWTSRIPTSVHLVHRPKDYLQIILLYILKKSQVLGIKLSISNLLRCKSIRRNTDMINPIFSKLLFYFF